MILATVVATPAQPLSAQEEEARPDCRCVDREGNEIEDCRCLRSVLPSAPLVRAWSWPHRGNARIGITVRTSQDARYDRRGVLVSDVLDDGPADRAGLREGDIITHVAGESVFDPLPDRSDEERLDPDRSVAVQRLLARLADLEPGEEVEIRYLRDGESRTAVVTAEQASQEPFTIRVGDGGAVRVFERGERGLRVDSLTMLLRDRDPCFHGGRARSFFTEGCVDGVEMEELNPSLGEYFGTEKGVLVTDVNDDNPLGLEAGDVILAIGGREVDEPRDVRRILGSYELEEELTLRLMRRGEVVEIRGTRR